MKYENDDFEVLMFFLAGRKGDRKIEETMIWKVPPRKDVTKYMRGLCNGP